VVTPSLAAPAVALPVYVALFVATMRAQESKYSECLYACVCVREREGERERERESKRKRKGVFQWVVTGMQTSTCMCVCVRVCLCGHMSHVTGGSIVGRVEDV